MLRPNNQTEVIIEMTKEIYKLKDAIEVQRKEIISMIADKNRVRDCCVRWFEELDVIINE